MRKFNRTACASRGRRGTAALHTAIEACEPRRLMASVSGVIYADENRNGRRDAYEAGVRSGAPASVYADVNYNGAFDDGEPSATTDASGAYSITGIPATGKSVAVRLRYIDPSRITQPAGGAHSMKFASDYHAGGRDFGIPGSIGGATSGIQFMPFDAKGNGVYGATVWLDLNKDGTRQSEEAVFDEMVGGESTLYYVAAAPGTYAVAMRLAGDADAIADYSVSVTVGAGENKGVAFTIPSAPAVSIVTGTVWSDTDKDGTRDSGEAGLANQTVYADLNGNLAYDAGETSVKTDASGFYTLGVPLQDGKRSISVRLADVPTSRVTAPSGGGHSGKFNVVLTAGNRNFGVAPVVVQTTTISGTIFNDTNLNGKLDAGEAGNGSLGISKVFVDLNHNGWYDEGEPSDTLNWHEESTYTIAGVPVGQSVDVAYYAEYGSWIEGGSVFQTTPRSFTYGPRTLTTTAAPVTGADFGFAVAGSIVSRPVIDADKDGQAEPDEFRISGNTWLDLDNDHVRDADEPAVTSRYEGNGMPPKGAWSLAVPYGTFTVAYAWNAAVGATADAFTTVTTSSANPDVTANLAVPPRGPAVTGVLFDDRNGNGLRDAEDGPLFQTIVYADYNGNGVRDAEDDFTLLDSVYTRSPTYYLPVAAGRSFTLRIQEYDGPTIRTTKTYAVGPLTGTQQFLNADFANPPATPQQFSTVTGTVWSDTDKDGVRDGGEAGLANQTVYADLNGNLAYDAGETSTVTNASGFYTLGVPLQDGKRSISVRLADVPASRVTAPSGGGHSGKFNVVLTAGNRNFGVAPA